ncbi:MAG: hypothetical protein RMX68_018435 [Aulosira sp. ZfuVER01]
MFSLSLCLSIEAIISACLFFRHKIYFLIIIAGYLELQKVGGKAHSFKE